MRLLPTPVLSFTDIRVGDGESPDVEMERFRAEVELAPLLKGEVRIIQMAVERPRFRIDIAGLATEGAGALARRLEDRPAARSRWSASRSSTARRSSTTAAPGGAGKPNDIDALVEAGSLRGPGKIEAEPHPRRQADRACASALGRIGADDTVAAKVSVDSPLYPLTLSTDGTLALGRASRRCLRGRRHAWPACRRPMAEPRSPWADFRAAGTSS